MRNYIINLILFFLPPSPDRFRKLKIFLLSWAGHKISKSARFMRIRVQGIQLIVGDNTFIGDETFISGVPMTTVKIGNNCDISSKVNIVTGTHKINSRNIEKAAGEGYGKDIRIGDGVWIGVGVTLLPGVSIGKGAIIAAGSLVNKNIPDYQIWGGVPARFIRTRN